MHQAVAARLEKLTGNNTRKMTVEDLPERSVEGDSLTERRCFLFPNSETSVTFSVAAAPMPSDCEFSFFDPNDAACQEILFNPKTSIPELFAILRQWVPQVQQNIDVIGNEIIKRGCNVNDRDGLTDMTLLHYTCKSGAHGIGDVETAVKFATQLIDLGADSSLRSRWTNMNALHYAAYFDVPELISVILKNAKPKDVDATCSDFDFGTALHIAAFNLCTGAVKCLLEHGANPAFRNDKGQIPVDVVPDPVDMPLEMADAAASAKEIKQILLDAVSLSCDVSKAVIPNRNHVGTLRFCGTTQFASGQWAGIELDEAEGKNNGSIGKVQYFKCAPKRGIFAPLSKISKSYDQKKPLVRSTSMRSSPLVKSKKIDVTHVTSKVNSGLNMSKKPSASETNLMTVNRGKTLPAKEGFPGYSSSSSSTTSLEGKQNYSKKRNLTSSNKKPLTRASSVSSKISAGLYSSSSSTRKFPFHEGEIQVGDRVLVVGQRTGTVRFCGTTKFAPGFWCGIELDKPHGKNDGSVGGVQYFSCLPRYGIFAPPSRVQRLTGSLDSLAETSSSKINHSFPGFRRSLSTTSASSQREINRRNSFVRSKSSMSRHSWSNTSATTTEGLVKLHEGSQVLLTSSNEMGTIRAVSQTKPSDCQLHISKGMYPKENISQSSTPKDLNTEEKETKMKETGMTIITEGPSAGKEAVPGSNIPTRKGKKTKTVLQEGGEKGSGMNKKTLSKIHNGEGFEDFGHKIVFPFANLPYFKNSFRAQVTTAAATEGKVLVTPETSRCSKARSAALKEGKGHLEHEATLPIYPPPPPPEEHPPPPPPKPPLVSHPHFFMAWGQDLPPVAPSSKDFPDHRKEGNCEYVHTAQNRARRWMVSENSHIKTKTKNNNQKIKQTLLIRAHGEPLPSTVLQAVYKKNKPAGLHVHENPDKQKQRRKKKSEKVLLFLLFFKIEEKCPPAVNMMPLDFELKSIGTFQFFSRRKGAYFQCRGNIRASSRIKFHLQHFSKKLAFQNICNTLLHLSNAHPHSYKHGNQLEKDKQQVFSSTIMEFTSRQYRIARLIFSLCELEKRHAGHGKCSRSIAYKQPSMFLGSRTGTQGTTEQREGKFRSLCEGKKKQNREMEEVNQKIRKNKKHKNTQTDQYGKKMGPEICLKLQDKNEISCLYANDIQHSKEAEKAATKPSIKTQNNLCFWKQLFSFSQKEKGHVLRIWIYSLHISPSSSPSRQSLMKSHAWPSLIDVPFQQMKEPSRAIFDTEADPREKENKSHFSAPCKNAVLKDTAFLLHLPQTSPSVQMRSDSSNSVSDPFSLGHQKSLKTMCCGPLLILPTCYKYSSLSAHFSLAGVQGPESEIFEKSVLGDLKVGRNKEKLLPSYKGMISLCLNGLRDQLLSANNLHHGKCSLGRLLAHRKQKAISAVLAYLYMPLNIDMLEDGTGLYPEGLSECKMFVSKQATSHVKQREVELKSVKVALKDSGWEKKFSSSKAHENEKTQSVSGSGGLCDSHSRGVTDQVPQHDNEHSDAPRCRPQHNSFIHAVMLSKHLLICPNLQALAAKSCPSQLNLLMRLGPMLRDYVAFRPQMDRGPSAQSRASADTHSTCHQYRSLDLPSAWFLWSSGLK
ncbi:CAP-Gly domain-containing linker protein 4 [Aix galericulata]|nr:CAP-Gly domain-containing linker protein 4 [Aix galericulata]